MNACPGPIDRGARDTETRVLDFCWFHGEEPMPENNYRTCFECGHYWTREALAEADAEHRGERIDPERIYYCPLCIHDF